MKLRGLTNGFLEGLAETIDLLNSVKTPVLLNPTIAVFSTLILTGTAALSYDLKLQASIFLISFILMLITHSLHRWIRLMIFVIAWATVVSAPLPFITLGRPLANLSLGSIQLTATCEGVNLMITFISRVVASAATFTSLVSIMGWRRTIMGLKGLRMPGEVALLLNLSIIHIPLFLREVSKMLSAREARIIGKPSFIEVWKIQATVVGDLLLRSHERAWMLEKAIKARSLGAESSRKTSSIKIGIKDLLLLSLSIFFFLLGVLDGL